MSETLLSIDHAALRRLDQWIADGWMRPLERALVALLIARGGEQDEQVLLLAALASQQLGQGDICVDLARALHHPERLFQRPGDRFSNDSPLHWLQQQTLPALHAALTASAVVTVVGTAADYAADRATDHAADSTVDDAAGETGTGKSVADATVADTSGTGTAQPDNRPPLVLDGNLLYLRRHYHYEITVADQLRQRLCVDIAPPANLAERLRTLFPDSANRPDWQKIACALATRSALTLITGGPGTGKTTTVVRLLGLLQSVAMEQGAPLRIRLAAPTGKAAARLSAAIGAAIATLPLAETVREQIPASVSTLHKLLGSRPDSRQFRHHRHHPLHADLLVVDEASMMDLEMTASLLDALRPDTRLILIGDKDQLASVEAGAVLGNLCADAEQGGYRQDTIDWLATQTREDISPWAGAGTDLAQQTVMLRHSHRFAADSGIGQLARAVNQGDQAALTELWQRSPADIERLTLRSVDDSALDSLCVNGYRHYLSQLQQQRPADPADIDSWANAVLDAFSHFQLLCAVREGACGINSINRRVAQTLKRAGLINRAEGWYEGRPVIMTGNDYALGLMNGDIGITLNLTGDNDAAQLRVAFRLADGRISLVLPSRLDGAESVYAMTVHKSQGSEFRHTALLLPDSGAAVSRELLYTAVTRARQHFTLAGSSSALARPTAATERAAGLAKRLRGAQ